MAWGRALPHLLVTAGALLGVGVEWWMYDWDQADLWVADLVVGWSFLGTGLVAWRAREAPAAGSLLVATGFAWFMGLGGATLYLHRGPLVHLLVAYPGWRLRSRMEATTIIAGYAAALLAPLWHAELGALSLCLLLLTTTVVTRSRARGRARKDANAAAAAAAGLACAVLCVVAARSLAPAGSAYLPSIYLYGAVLAATAAVLVLRLPRPPGAEVTDAVVELSETRSTQLSAELGRILGDPSLVVGYWSVEVGAYVDELGRAVHPDSSAGRSATYVDEGSRPYAVLVHDADVLRDAAIVEAVARATRMAEVNTALQTEVRSQVVELSASRRRVVLAADAERHDLSERLRAGPRRRLERVALLLAALPDDAEGASLARARGHLVSTSAALDDLELGLLPRELTESGLAGALRRLASRSPVPVRLRVADRTFEETVETTAYFVCAEALSNVAKHAGATAIEVVVRCADGRVSVSVADDGAGGADLALGSGLQGLQDRVTAVGGTLTVHSPPGSGTRVQADFPAALHG